MIFEDKIERGSLTTTDQAVTLSLPGMSAVMVQLGGTWTGTFTFEVLVDEGTSPTWKSVLATNTATGAQAATATAVGIYQANVAAARQFRARFSTASSGTAVVAVNASRGVSTAGGSSTATISGTVTVAGATAGGSAFTGPSVPIGFVGTGGTMRNATAAPSLSATTGVDALGVGPLLKDLTGGNYFNQAGDASGRAAVVGPVAQGSATTGTFPVLMGGSNAANNSAPCRVFAPTDAQAASVEAMVAYAQQGSYNGTTWDRQRGSQDVVLHASAVTGTGTVNTDITTYNYGYLVIHANVTLYNAGTVLFKVQMMDANSIFVDIPLATTGAVASGADIFLTVGPASWPANATPVFYANAMLPRVIRIVQTVAAASVTFSAAYCLKN